MNKIHTITQFALFAVAILSGCTMPTLKTALVAREKEQKQYATIVDDLARQAKQQALDRRAMQAQLASEADDLEGVKLAVERAFNDAERISFLQTEAAKARYGLGGIVNVYLFSQEGFGDILLREWNEAKATTQPAR